MGRLVGGGGGGTDWRVCISRDIHGLQLVGIIHTYLMQLTQSEWALSLLKINLPLRGSKTRMLLLAQAATRSDLNEK